MDSVKLRAVRIEYTNYRGSRSWRTIIPMGIEWGQNEWHTEAQWLLHAHDCDKHGSSRTFAIKNIHDWQPTNWVPVASA